MTAFEGVVADNSLRLRLSLGGRMQTALADPSHHARAYAS
jgi:hypothetical protein